MQYFGLHEIDAKNVRVGLTFDDVLLVPKRSDIKSRKNVNTKTMLSRNIELNIPIVSANMDTVTESEMAITIARLGGIGIIHRFLTQTQQVSEVLKVKRSEGIMIEQPITINSDGTVYQVKELMRNNKIGGILVKNDNDKLIGIITKRDLFFEYDDKKPVKDIMSKDLITAPDGTTLDEAKKIFIDNKIEKLPIVSSEGNLIGLITSKDIDKRERFPIASKDNKGRLMVGAAIGVKDNDLDRAQALCEAGADTIVVDIAHGHSDLAIDMITKLRKHLDGVDIIAGNVATSKGAEDLIKADVDGIKIGVGSGSICITRIVTGTGVPQLTAINDAAIIAQKHNVPVIADGGIRTSGDITKAIAAGSSSIMIGSLLAGTDESPGITIMRPNGKFKMTRGMASLSAAVERKSKESESVDENYLLDYVPEGVEAMVPHRGQATDVINKLVGGLRSGLSYSGAHNLNELRDNSEFIRITEAGKAESGPHDVNILD